MRTGDDVKGSAPLDPIIVQRRLRYRGRQNGRRFGGSVAVSLTLHAAVLLALILRLDWKRGPEPLPPPSTVSMVFEGGRPEGPTTEQPSPEPEASNAPPSQLGSTPPSTASPPPEAEAGAPAPSTASSSPPEPSPPPQLTLAEPPPVPPSIIPPPPVPPAPPPPPSEPAPAEVVVPPPPPPAPVPPVRQATPQRPQSWPPIRQPVPSQTPSEFPAPMKFSFGPSEEKPGLATPGRPFLSLGLPKRGLEDSTPYSLDIDAEVGPDWRNALSEWVQEHSYYPEQAAELHQQGSVKVQVTTTPEGHVISVDMERRSGSPWLDLALDGLFRGAKLPPMPKSAGDQPVTFHFTMHYILIR